ncbi:flagellar motor switch protein FliN [Porticoccus sp.]
MSENENTPSAADDWDVALAEQAAEAPQGDVEDPWADALAEQQAAVASPAKEPVAAQPAAAAATAESKTANGDIFKPLNKGESVAPPRELEMVMDIPVKLNVELGRTRITIKQLLELTQGSVVELEGLAGDPMDILINGHLIAQGEVVVVDDKYGIRVTDIITPSERAQKLNR